MLKKLNNLKKDKKGFTLVELIVVLVILAILMAVLIPALLGWIDKAKQTQILTNANAALVAAQGLADEAYGNDVSNPTTYVTNSKIKSLTDIQQTFTFSATFGTTGKKSKYKITKFTYTENSQTVEWEGTTGKWTKKTS
ncbi:MAG: type II secretion system GspH family protein [Lachnospiraceae bacterium]|nr:type II secretion system GspH family protein [Lachnospiraceae bacterium]